MSRDNKYVNLVFEHLDCDLYQYITDPCYSKDSITKKVGILFSLWREAFSALWIDDDVYVLLLFLAEFSVSNTLCCDILPYS